MKNSSTQMEVYTTNALKPISTMSCKLYNSSEGSNVVNLRSCWSSIVLAIDTSRSSVATEGNHHVSGKMYESGCASQREIAHERIAKMTEECCDPSVGASTSRICASKNAFCRACSTVSVVRHGIVQDLFQILGYRVRDTR